MYDTLFKRSFFAETVMYYTMTTTLLFIVQIVLHWGLEMTLAIFATEINQSLNDLAEIKDHYFFDSRNIVLKLYGSY